VIETAYRLRIEIKPAGKMLDIRDLSVTYAGGKTGIRRATLTFWPREFTVLLGPSGAGKSTLLRALNGLVPASGGEIVAAGLGRLAGAAAWRRHRQQTAMIFQQHQLIGRRTALANVLTGRLGYHGMLRSLLPLPAADCRIALDCLDRIGLLPAALQRADRLSGGEQQRVGIARALAQQPRMILADEPVASLDPETAVKVLTLLHGICRDDGLSAVVSLHQVALARQFGDRIIGLVAGGVVFDGPPAALTAADLARIYNRSTLLDRRPAASPAAVPSLSLAPEEV
jgi:phosphonate transport system ATP-binding protein